MRIEIAMLVITLVCIVNVYYNGQMMKWIYKQKKFVQIGGILLLSGSVYLMLKRNPTQAKKILLHANNYVKYMPVNKSTVDTFSNIFDFTEMANVDTMNHLEVQPSQPSQKTKRSVSETKKKYVASMQDWKCGKCQTKLNAWYEVDHKKRLEYGGTNNVDNLVALCRECHGEKTAMENM
jgi:HNH endonuclease